LATDNTVRACRLSVNQACPNRQILSFFLTLYKKYDRIIVGKNYPQGG